MTAIFIAVTADDVTIMSDAARYNPVTGVMMQIAEKQTFKPGLNLIYAVMGEGAFDISFELELLQRCPLTFDAFLDDASDLILKAFNVFDRHHPASIVFVFGGYSESRQAFEAYVCSSLDQNDDQAKYTPFTVAPVSLWAKPDPSPDMALKYIGGDPEAVARAEGLFSLGYRYMMAVRHTKTPQFGMDPEKTQYSVGGFIQHSTITRQGIATRIVHRWPDEIGRTIDPTLDPN